MASIRQRNGKWQARIIRKGHPNVTRTFHTKQDAERWSRATEVALDRGVDVSAGKAERTTFGELIARYMHEVTPTLKGARDDSIRLNALMRHPICKLSVGRVTPSRIAEFRDERLRQVAPGTVIRELAYFSAIINHARREWGFNLENPVSRVRKPQTPAGRERVLSESEQDRLLEALRPSGRRSPWMFPLVVLALESAMRRSELLKLAWQDVDLSNQTATLHDTKNGEVRIVPLSKRAVEVLQALPRSITGKVIPMSQYAVAAAFDRAMARASVSGFRFHDLRHTAVTRMAQKLPNLIELAAVTGHKSLRMLQRYYHPQPTDLAKKLG